MGILDAPSYSRTQTDAKIAATDATLRSITSTIGCLGDSLTAGNQDATGITYPQQLGTGLPDVTVVNLGLSGATATEVAIRAGAVDLTLGAFTLPADTSSVAVVPTISTTDWHVGQTYVGVLTGGGTTYAGTLTETSPGGSATWTFARTTAGSSVNVPDGATFHCTAYDAHIDKLTLIEVGRNSIVYGDQTKITPMVQAIANRLSPTLKRYLVLAVPTRTTEGTGTTNYNKVAAVNAELAAAFPDRYVDWRRYVIDNGLTLNGITATTDDTAAIAADTIPPSLSFDGLHPNQFGYRAMATPVLTALAARGWASGRVKSVAPIKGTVITSDAFTRADSVTLGNSDVSYGGTVKSWTTGNQQILGNQLTGTASAGASRLNASQTNHRIEALLKNAYGIGLMVGFVDTSNYYYVIPTSSAIQLWRRAAGTNTQLASFPTTIKPFDTFAAARIDDKLIAYVNDYEVGRVSDTTLTTGTFVGVRSNAADTASAVDDIIVRTF